MQPESPDLREKLKPIRRRWKLIAIIVLAITALTYYYYRHQPPSYVASTMVFVQADNQIPGSPGGTGESDPQRRLANAATLLQTPTVAAQVAKAIHYTGNPSALLGLISVIPSSNSDFLVITATSSDARAAAAVANGFANTFVEVTTAQTRAIVAAAEQNVENQLAATPPTPAYAVARQSLEQQLQTLRLNGTSGGVESIDPAPVPTVNTASSPKQNAIFGAILGLVLACALVMGIEAFSRRLRHPMVEAEYGLPLLAKIPFSRAAHGAMRMGSGVPTTLMEGVRGLRTMLEHGGTAGVAPRTLLVTSAIPGEGKSTLVKSLGLAYFESAKSVLVIDADFRHPMLHEFFEAPLVPGLSDVLRGSILLSEAAQEVQPADIEPAFDPVLTDAASTVMVGHAREGRGEPTVLDAHARSTAGGPIVHLLAAGTGTSDPAALLGSAQLKALVGEATAKYDLVLIDSPPVLSVSDAIPLATAVDAVIVVARPEFTTRDAAQRCHQALERVSSVTVLGVVANAVREDDELGRLKYLTSSS
jgi:Mrp family chromosome partitioning ATPase/capsular polysaccharide biosynthesis protein